MLAIITSLLLTAQPPTTTETGYVYAVNVNADARQPQLRGLLQVYADRGVWPPKVYRIPLTCQIVISGKAPALFWTLQSMKDARCTITIDTASGEVVKVETFEFAPWASY